MANSPIVTRINALLAEKGITKQTFYQACGITSASYSLWNTGKTQPRMKNLEIIAAFLDVSVSYLVEGVEQKENPATDSSEVLDDDTIELRSIWDTGDKEERDALLAMARMLKARRTQ